jgi:hypothetical protein
MAVTGTYQITTLDANRALPNGRHRLGSPGLEYVRNHRPVRARLATQHVTRHAAPVSPRRAGAELAIVVAMLVLTGTVLVSGWYAATGAAVIADMLSW